MPGSAIAIWSGSSDCSANASPAASTAVAHRPVATSAGTSASARSERARRLVGAGNGASTASASRGRPAYVSTIASLRSSSSLPAGSLMRAHASRATSSASSARNNPHIRLRARISTMWTRSGSPSAADGRSRGQHLFGLDGRADLVQRLTEEQADLGRHAVAKRRSRQPFDGDEVMSVAGQTGRADEEVWRRRSPTPRGGRSPIGWRPRAGGHRCDRCGRRARAAGGAG